MRAERQHHNHTEDRRRITEQAMDYLTIGFVVALGLAMLAGLLTAAGTVTW